jgi:hypothetical protein
MSVRKEHFDSYIRTFLSYFIELSRVVDSEIREVAFPKFLLVPYKIKCVISNTHGLSIEFLEKSANYQISIVKVNNRIEEAIFPQKNSKTPCFEISTNRFIDITGMVVVSQDFRDKHVTEMTSGITYRNPVDGFLHIAPGGDVKFHNSQFGAIIAGDPKYVKTGDCLWIYGSNREEDFTIEMAKSRALEEFNVDLATLIHNKYDISAIDGQKKTIEVFNNKIQKLEQKIREDATEPQLQDFFEKNPEFLFFGNRYSKSILT